jgi:superfamily II DNA or RNA helicase
LWFAERLQRYAENLFVLTGGLDQKTRKDNLDALLALSRDEQRVVVATGSFIGEGFDDPPLDTLLLAAPISWRGMLAQYVGRLHRQHPGKDEVWVFDYVDSEVPVLAKMFRKRATGYRALGYTEGEPPSEFELMADPAFDADVLWDEPWEDAI